MYAFATEYAAYREAHGRDGRRIQLEATIADLEDALAHAHHCEVAAVKAATEDEERADHFQSIIETVIDKIEAITREAETSIPKLRGELSSLVKAARKKEKELDSDGSQDRKEDH